MTARTKVITGIGLLVLFWAAAAVPAVVDAVRVMSARVTAAHLSRPIGTLVLSLEAERRVSAAAPPAGPGLAAQRDRTNQARRALRSARAGWTTWLADSDATRAADALLTRADTLTALRSSVDSQQIGRGQAVDAYTNLIDPDPTVPPTVFPDQLAGPSGKLMALSRSRELLAEEDAQLVAGAGADRLSTLAGGRRTLYATGGGDLPAGTYGQLMSLEDELMAGHPPAVAAWSTAFNPVNSALWDEQTTLAHRQAGAATPHAVLSVVRAGLLGGVGLIALIAVLVVARRSDAGPAAPGSARSAADDRSESVTARLDPLVRDLERRNEGLLHRQLRLLDTLARRESDDETLGDLFRVDQFANRIRRNLEKAITLVGGRPGRRWSRPVPLVEVVRGAAAEVADHHRVSTSQLEPVHLAGDAVTDLMHLLAELIENAATFAPAESRVRVAGSSPGEGYRITVSDVGPGMTDEDLATAAEVMADPEPPAGGAWWGLYAAGRFAERHGIAVILHNGLDGGLTAEVTVPAALISEPLPSFDDQPTAADLRTATSA